MMSRALVFHQTHLATHENAAQSFKLKPIEHECLLLLQKCTSIHEFKKIHAQILKIGFDRHASDLVAACALSVWGSMDYALSIFNQIEYPSTFGFNTMIKGYVDDGNPEAAVLLYKGMQERDVKPDNYTHPLVLKSCAHLSALREGIQIHGHIFKFGFDSDVFVQSSLINMYGKCSEIELSCRVFDQMDQRGVASWSALIAAHNRLGLWDKCLCLFRVMGFEGWRADESTLVSVLSSCTHLGALDLGRYTHCYLLRNISGLNFIVETSLIDMYVKCGSIKSGVSVFDRMTTKNVLSYSVMISGLAIHGRGKEALRVFSDMLAERLEPDNVVYLGVLHACSQAGLVDEGLQFFDRMRFEHRIMPTIQHYGCMVDLMGRAGMLNQAYGIIKSMPMEPNDAVWRCLLSACKVHRNLKLGELAARNLFQIARDNPGDYMLLSNIYAQARRWEDAANIRTDMVENCSFQMPGFSMVEVKRKLHKFVSQDKSNPQSNAVYEMLHQIGWQLKFEGYAQDTSQVLFDVEEEEKQRLLHGHSQKLAIAFALINTRERSTIRIIRNLRMCNDCHTCTRMISKIYEREILVRDRNRFHHFKEGMCSCGDYW